MVVWVLNKISKYTTYFTQFLPTFLFSLYPLFITYLHEYVTGISYKYPPPLIHFKTPSTSFFLIFASLQYIFQFDQIYATVPVTLVVSPSHHYYFISGVNERIKLHPLESVPLLAHRVCLTVVALVVYTANNQNLFERSNLVLNKSFAFTLLFYLVDLQVLLCELESKYF